MKSKLKLWWTKLSTYLANKYDEIHESNQGWVKTGLALAALVGIGLLFVAIVCAFVLFLVIAPGLVIGTIAWFPWTYLQLGATYFPDLDPRWLNIQWFHFVLATAALAWIGKLFRPKRAPTLAEELGSYRKK